MTFDERVWPNIWWWLWIPASGLAGFLLAAPLGSVGSLIGCVLATGGTGFALSRSALRINVESGWLRVGRAKIEVSYLDEATLVTQAQWSDELGARMDARAYISTRPWVKCGVRVTLRDDRDPTPYWLFSTRRGAELITVLRDQAAHSEHTGDEFSS